MDYSQKLNIFRISPDFKCFAGNHTEEILVRNTYNELSQLTNKKVGGISASNPLQSIDYAYNVCGWVTKVNDPDNLGSDLFGYAINTTILKIRAFQPAGSTGILQRSTGEPLQ